MHLSDAHPPSITQVVISWFVEIAYTTLAIAALTQILVILLISVFALFVHVHEIITALYLVITKLISSQIKRIKHLLRLIHHNSDTSQTDPLDVLII
jgi:hypothetical protein